jgi:hypothetical protein
VVEARELYHRKRSAATTPRSTRGSPSSPPFSVALWPSRRSPPMTWEDRFRKPGSSRPKRGSVDGGGHGVTSEARNRLASPRVTTDRESVRLLLRRYDDDLYAATVVEGGTPLDNRDPDRDLASNLLGVASALAACLHALRDPVAREAIRSVTTIADAHVRSTLAAIARHGPVGDEVHLTALALSPHLGESPVEEASPASPTTTSHQSIDLSGPTTAPTLTDPP